MFWVAILGLVFPYLALSRTTVPGPGKKAGIQSNLASASSFRKAPYLLFPDDSTRMLILWQLKTTQNCTVQWGTDTTYAAGKTATTEYGTDHQHKMMLSGLSPQTHYFYKVVVDKTGEEKTGSFYTGEGASAKTVHFYAYGDTRTYPAEHNKVALAVLKAIKQDSSSQTFIVNSGDLVSDGDRESYWDNQFFDPSYGGIQKMLATLPYLSAIGNHEGNGYLFKKYFPYPMYSEGGNYYYSFDYGPVHFTVTDEFTNYKPGSKQYQWLVNDLSTTKKRWKIILMHEPPWSAGGHSNNLTAQKYIHPLCRKFAVQFVICGHNHYYARASVDGVQYITTGGGGAPLYTPNPDKEHIVRVDKSHHFCKLDVDGDTLSFTAIRSDNSVIESFKYYVGEITAVHSGQSPGPSAKVYAADNTVYLHLLNGKRGRYEIFDEQGNCIMSHPLEKTAEQIKLTKTGIYFVRITTNGQVFTKKVWIK